MFVEVIINYRIKFNFQLNTNSRFLSLSISQPTARTLWIMECLSLYNVESYSSAFLIYLIEFLSLLACLSEISDLVYSVFIARTQRRNSNQVRNTRSRSFSYALPESRRHFRVCMRINGVTEWREPEWCRTCYTRVRERHVPLGAASRPRLMFQRCRVRRRSCCSLYHRDLGGINRETRLFDRDRDARAFLSICYIALHCICSKRLILIERTYEFKKKRLSSLILRIMSF